MNVTNTYSEIKSTQKRCIRQLVKLAEKRGATLEFNVNSVLLPLITVNYEHFNIVE